MKDRYIAVVLILLLLLLSVVGIAVLAKKSADSRREAQEVQKKEELYNELFDRFPEYPQSCRDRLRLLCPQIPLSFSYSLDRKSHKYGTLFEDTSL